MKNIFSVHEVNGKQELFHDVPDALLTDQVLLDYVIPQAPMLGVSEDQVVPLKSPIDRVKRDDVLASVQFPQIFDLVGDGPDDLHLFFFFSLAD